MNDTLLLNTNDEGTSFKNVYIVELPLAVEVWQADIIDKRMEIGRYIYNALLNIVSRRYNEMIKTKIYRESKEQLAINDDKKKSKLTKEEKERIKQDNKILYEQLQLLEQQYKLTKYDIVSDVKEMQHHFKCHIHSRVAQEIAKNVYSSLYSVLHGKGKKFHFKKYGTFNSLRSNESNKAIIFNHDAVLWTGLTLKIEYPHSPKSLEYVQRNLFNNLPSLRYCAIVRKCIRGQNKYYVQLTFKCTMLHTKRRLGKGRVGLDIGTSTLAIASNTEVNLIELADKVQNYEKEIAKLQRKMDRSRRANNPNKYNEDGTYKKGNKDKWNNSNRYKKCQLQLRELYRKQRVTRRLQHGALSNHILSLGDEFYVEKMNFKSLQKRSKKTEKKANGRYKCKKRYGKSLGNRAPSMLLTLLNNKLHHFYKELNEINTQKCKASQFNHATGEYKKKSLGQRWNIINNQQVQRDLYSAFLISNVNSTLDSFNIDLCDSTYDNFLTLHNNKIEELKLQKQVMNKSFLSCMGI
jgi:hypothetical protein